ncbi:conditioned medium-induced protein 4 [Halobacteriales archaeon QS_1_68_20]|nr:MAG: conditioned medium-induced protein 4 [Halobacteriales archaeon QS_1_68_20]
MDDKTEELRDIFVSVSGEEAVTERQEEVRGSLTDERDDEEVEEVVATMADRYEFDSDFDRDELVTVATEFYDDADDVDIADALSVSRHDAFQVRMDLHLVTDEDLDPAFDADAAEDLLDSEPPETVADELGTNADAVRRYAHAREARNRSLRANERFRDRFDEILADSDLATRLAQDVQEDGLDEATEGLETDVSF